jgi:hypothetical protein
MIAGSIRELPSAAQSTGPVLNKRRSCFSLSHSSPMLRIIDTALTVAIKIPVLLVMLAGYIPMVIMSLVCLIAAIIHPLTGAWLAVYLDGLFGNPSKHARLLERLGDAVFHTE